GTWSLMGIESRTPLATPLAHRLNYTNEGGVEHRFRVLKNLAGMWPIQRLAAEHNVDDFGALVAAAAAEPAFRSVVDPGDQFFLNPPSMTEALKSYMKQNGEPVPETLAGLARAVFDSLALCYGNVKSQLEEISGRKLTRVRIVGGGCQNQLVNQLCANACQVPVTAGPIEASALGNLSAQLIALGEIESLDAARAIVRASFPMKEHEPDGTVPDAVYRRFNQLLEAKSQRGAKEA
ncbi:MAG: FGGY-family carbohydrate kinase, partial [Terracidiphilus sp.]